MEDLNADPGTHRGLLSTTPANEQGHILNKYIQLRGFTLVHLHLNDSPLLTNLKTAPNSASQLLITLSVLLAIFRTLNLVMLFMTTPSNTLNHCPLVAEIKRDILHSPQLKKKHTTYKWNELIQKKKKQILESYSAALHNRNKLSLPIRHPSTLEEHLKYICYA